ncbi:MAG: GUN4 domain-containing protein [Synechococcus sp.]
MAENEANTERSLEDRVTQLEKRLDDALACLSDTYRYGRLRDLLAAGQWKEADKETTKVLVDVSGKANQDDIAPADMQTYPCSALRTIDGLWMKYSNGRFGFGLQLKTYLEVGGSINALRAEDLDPLKKTAEKVGWRKNGARVEYDDFDFSLEAPPGALPHEWWSSPYGAKMANFFMTSLIRCEL